MSDGQLDVTAKDSAGVIQAESISRDFGTVRANVGTNLGQPSKFASSRRQRISGFVEEGIAAAALAKDFNSAHGTQYRVKEKVAEDSDYEDRILVSAVDSPERILVQIRHLDEEIISSLGKTGEFAGTRNVFELAAKINKSINEKSRVDSAIKSQTILLLQIPSPIGKILRREIQRSSFDLRGFRAVWISPFQEECFPVFSAIDESELAIAAYYQWQKDGPFWANDQHHWFKAIDEIRGLLSA